MSFTFSRTLGRWENDSLQSILDISCSFPTSRTSSKWKKMAIDDALVAWFPNCVCRCRWTLKRSDLVDSWSFWLNNRVQFRILYGLRCNVFWLQFKMDSILNCLRIRSRSGLRDAVWSNLARFGARPFKRMHKLSADELARAPRSSLNERWGRRCSWTNAMLKSAIFAFVGVAGTASSGTCLLRQQEFHGKFS